MQNYIINKFMYNATFRSQVQILLLRDARAYSNSCKSGKPGESTEKAEKWQWEVRRCPESTCKNPCVPKKCPKKTWFPSFRKAFIQKDVKSCKPVEEKTKKKKMTWGEYFSYLLPDEYQRPKPPLVTCRRLLMLRNEKCATECPRECPPKTREWKGQAVMRTELTCAIPQISTGPKPCPPPSHVLPRGVMVKKGICPIKGKTDPSPEAHRIKLPYDEFKAAKMSLEALAEKPFQLRSSKVCKIKDPVLGDKSSKLKCRSYAGLKSVECPQQVYTRYKSVDIPPASCGELRPLRPVAASSFDLSKLRPKRGCSDYSKPQTRELHTFVSKVELIETSGKSSLSEAIKRFDLQPANSVFEVKKLIESRSFESAVKERPKTAVFIKPAIVVKPTKKMPEEESIEEVEVATPKSSFDKSVQAFRSLIHHVEPYSSIVPSPRLSLHRENQSGAKRFIHKRRFSSKKHETPCKGGCSPTAKVIAQKGGKVKAKTTEKEPMNLKRHCKLHLSKECPCMPSGYSIEVRPVNPYQAARKKPALSICNQPRKGRPQGQSNKSFHTSFPRESEDASWVSSNIFVPNLSDRLVKRSFSGAPFDLTHSDLAPEEEEKLRRAKSEERIYWSKGKGKDDCSEKKRKAFCEKKNEGKKKDVIAGQKGDKKRNEEKKKDDCDKHKSGKEKKKEEKKKDDCDEKKVSKEKKKEEKKKDDCNEQKGGKEKKLEKKKKDDCDDQKGEKEKKKSQKFDPYNVKRESCYPRPKKNKNASKKEGGIVCKIASIFGIGCGKKKPKGTC